MDATRAGDFLALVNASLNGASAVALFTGFYFIRRKVVDAHKRAMLTAVGASALFLVFYLTRVALTGTHQVAGTGMARTVYLTILVSHPGGGGGALRPAPPPPGVQGALRRAQATGPLRLPRVGLRLGDGAPRLHPPLPDLRLRVSLLRGPGRLS